MVATLTEGSEVGSVIPEDDPLGEEAELGGNMMIFKGE